MVSRFTVRSQNKRWWRYPSSRGRTVSTPLSLSCRVRSPESPYSGQLLLLWFPPLLLLLWWLFSGPHAPVLCLQEGPTHHFFPSAIIGGKSVPSAMAAISLIPDSPGTMQKRFLSFPMCRLGTQGPAVMRQAEDQIEICIYVSAPAAHSPL